MVSAVALLSFTIILAGLGGGLGVSWLFLGMFSVGSAPNFSLFLVIFAATTEKKYQIQPKTGCKGKPQTTDSVSNFICSNK